MNFFSFPPNYCQKQKTKKKKYKPFLKVKSDRYIHWVTDSRRLSERKNAHMGRLMMRLQDFQFQSGTLYLATPWPFLITCGLPLEPFIMRRTLWDSHLGLLKKYLYKIQGGQTIIDSPPPIFYFLKYFRFPETRDSHCGTIVTATPLLGKKKQWRSKKSPKGSTCPLRGDFAKLLLVQHWRQDGESWQSAAL